VRLEEQLNSARGRDVNNYLEDDEAQAIQPHSKKLSVSTNIAVDDVKMDPNSGSSSQ
jgi:hypothetical protein